MAFNALIAQGIQPIGADVPQIANMLNQRRQQQFQNSLATNQDARAQGEYSANMAAAADQRQRARSQQDAQQAYTEAQYIKQAKDEELLWASPASERTSSPSFGTCSPYPRTKKTLCTGLFIRSDWQWAAGPLGRARGAGRR